ncbi:Hypothetical protein HVR_LOCUS86 [uncultured virus]|nr:Hypothetical protein HVR_LOCUS86 [uncultured virus]
MGAALSGCAAYPMCSNSLLNIMRDDTQLNSTNSNPLDFRSQTLKDFSLLTAGSSPLVSEASPQVQNSSTPNTSSLYESPISVCELSSLNEDSGRTSDQNDETPEAIATTVSQKENISNEKLDRIILLLEALVQKETRGLE